MILWNALLLHGGVLKLLLFSILPLSSSKPPPKIEFECHASSLNTMNADLPILRRCRCVYGASARPIPAAHRRGRYRGLGKRSKISNSPFPQILLSMGLVQIVNPTVLHPMLLASHSVLPYGIAPKYFTSSEALSRIYEAYRPIVSSAFCQTIFPASILLSSSMSFSCCSS